MSASSPRVRRSNEPNEVSGKAGNDMGQSSQPEGNPTTVARQAGREIIVTRIFDHPAQAVFEAWIRLTLGPYKERRLLNAASESTRR
jgi:hypothetical protein